MNSELSVREQWEGLRFLDRAHKPKRRARRDRNGRIVSMDMRAEVTKEYPEKDHWEKKDKALTTEPHATESTKKQYEIQEQKAGYEYSPNNRKRAKGGREGKLW